MKKILSCALVGLLLLQSADWSVLAADAGSIAVQSVSVGAGEEFDLPVVLEKNPGIAALSLNLTYDAAKLELTGVTDGKLLGTSTFVAGDDLTRLPYIMNWDNLASENNAGTGTLATLKFRAKDSAAGQTEVAVEINQKSTFNVDLDEVAFESISGTVSISADENAPVIAADTVSANPGGTVQVPIRIRNNPGITALSLEISYDASQLQLVSAEEGKILGSSTFLTSDDPARIPYILNWDDLASENNTGNGIAATLTFTVSDSTSGTIPIAVALNQKSTFNVDLDEVFFAVENGAVQIGAKTGTTVTDQPGTTTEATEQTTTTLSSASTTTTITTTTETTAAIPENAAVIVDTVTAHVGDTVDVPIRLSKNPGIAALSLDVSYDNTLLKLVGAEDGKILGDSTFLSGDDFSKIPYTLNWDDLSTENNTYNGIVAKLRFEVIAESGNAEIMITVKQKSTFDVDLVEVAFATVSGYVTIVEKSGDTNGDGEITVADAVLLMRFISEDGNLETKQIDRIILTQPDLNSDNLITVLDVQLLLKMLELNR